MTKKKRATGISAADLMADLNADPEFVAKRACAEHERLERVAEWRRAEAPLVAELRAAGLTVESAWDLVNTASPYPGALRILLDHVRRPYPARVREGIARALAVPAAKFGWSALKRLYSDEQDHEVKDALAVALAAIADAEVIDEVIALARDGRHGASRLLLLSALERSSDPRARPALMELGTDAELEREVQVILRRLDRKRKR